MRSTSSASSSQDVGGRGWGRQGHRDLEQGDRVPPASLSLGDSVSHLFPPDIASILIPLLLLLLVLLVAGVVFWYKRRVQG